jgi:hypothetical protein
VGTIVYYSVDVPRNIIYVWFYRSRIVTKSDMEFDGSSKNGNPLLLWLKLSPKSAIPKFILYTFSVPLNFNLSYDKKNSFRYGIVHLVRFMDFN